MKANSEEEEREGERGGGEGWREDIKATTGTLELPQQGGRKEGEEGDLSVDADCSVVAPVEDPNP